MEVKKGWLLPLRFLESYSLFIVLGAGGVLMGLRGLFFSRIKTLAYNLYSSIAPWPRKAITGKGSTRGDGLESIYRPASDKENSFHDGSMLYPDLHNLNLSKVQQQAFEVLFDCNVIDSGMGLPIIQNILDGAKLLQLKKSDFVNDLSKKRSNELQILVRGSIELLYSDDSTSTVVLEVGEKKVLASALDIVSWIMGDSICDTLISVRCVDDCEVISIPSPSFSSDAELFLCANFVRSLLIRFCRTTITSSMFYLGLAEYISPKTPSVAIPTDLQHLSGIIEFAPNNSATVYGIKKLLSHFFGTKQSCIHLPIWNSDAQYSMRPHVGMGVIPLQLRRAKGNSVGNNLAGLAQPPGLKRSKSDGFQVPYDDSAFDSRDSIMSEEMASLDSSLSGLCVNEDGFVRTGLLRLKCGQSILDVDSVPGCYIILSGRVSVKYLGYASNSNTNNNILMERSFPLLGRRGLQTETVYQPGDVLGQIALFLGDSTEWYGRRDNNLASSAMMMLQGASDVSYLLKVPVTTMEGAAAEHPRVVFHVARSLVSEIPPLIRLYDFCTKWIKLSGGQDVVHHGQKATGKLFVVLFGRVRLISPNENDHSRVHNIGGEERQHWIMGRGALIGDSQILTGSPYQYTVRAVRQTMLSEISEQFLDFLSNKFPSIITCIARNVTDKQQLSQIGSPSSKSFFVLPISSSAPANMFCSTLKKCCSHCANKVYLVKSDDVRAIFDTILDGLSDREYILTVGNWLHQIEMDSDIVIYQADRSDTMWNQLCLIRSDEIILLANAIDISEGVHAKRLERSVLDDSSSIPKTLVLVYINPTASCKPRGSREWIEARSGINRHVNVRIHTNDTSNYDTKHYSSDFNRLARILTNNAVGLVLGGGGARGISHLGVIQALEEHGIPIDIVGGTSIGAFIGACYAKETSFMSVLPIVKAWAQLSSSYWFYILDLTFPMTSYFNGFHFTKSIADIFKKDKIEDFWLNYYCVSTDLTNHGQRVHMNGTAYRYIRSSMSLANYLPPLCDWNPLTSENHYLVDGGYVNCVPVSVMRQEMGAKTIIAVDVSGNWRLLANYDYGNHLSGWKVLFAKLNPFGPNIQVPSMGDIADQLAFVSAVQQVERVKEEADICIFPPVQKYSVLDFGSFDVLRKLGLDSARSAIKKWLRKVEEEAESSNRQDGKYSWINNTRTKLSFEKENSNEQVVQ